MSQLKVSIIILTYNNLECLKGAIDSILMQTYRNVEVIIHDDGTNDFDKEKIFEYFNGCENQFTNIIIAQNDKNLGTVKNYNEAIKKAKGDIIAPLACDDTYIDCNVISDLVDLFNQTGCSICYAYGKGKNSGTIIRNESLVRIFKKCNKLERVARLYYGNWYMNGAATYYKREYLESTNGFDENFFLMEDYPANLKAIQNDVNVFFWERTTILYGEDGVSSGKMNPLLLNDLKRVYELLIFPNIDAVLTKKQRRAVNFAYERLSKGVRGITCYLKYIDIVFLKIKKRIWSSVLNKEIDEFKLLLDR